MIIVNLHVVHLTEILCNFLNFVFLFTLGGVRLSTSTVTRARVTDATEFHAP